MGKDEYLLKYSEKIFGDYFLTMVFKNADGKKKC
jgi:hypothetical protein